MIGRAPKLLHAVDDQFDGTLAYQLTLNNPSSQQVMLARLVHKRTAGNCQTIKLLPSL